MQSDAFLSPIALVYPLFHINNPFTDQYLFFMCFSFVKTFIISLNTGQIKIKYNKSSRILLPLNHHLKLLVRNIA